MSGLRELVFRLCGGHVFDQVHHHELKCTGLCMYIKQYSSMYTQLVDKPCAGNIPPYILIIATMGGSSMTTT